MTRGTNFQIIQLYLTAACVIPLVLGCSIFMYIHDIDIHFLVYIESHHCS